jgi:hypothetical protein
VVVKASFFGTLSMFRLPPAGLGHQNAMFERRVREERLSNGNCAHPITREPDFMSGHLYDRVPCFEFVGSYSLPNNDISSPLFEHFSDPYGVSQAARTGLRQILDGRSAPCCLQPPALNNAASLLKQSAVCPLVTLSRRVS